MHRQIEMAAPLDHLHIQIFHWMTAIHHHDDALEALALFNVIGEQAAPLLPNRRVNLGEAVAGKVDNTATVIKGEEVDQLCSPGGFADACEILLVADCIDCAGFSGIGSTRKCDFQHVLAT